MTISKIMELINGGKDEAADYLSPNAHVRYDGDSSCAKAAAEIAASCGSQSEFVRAAAENIKAKMEYDYPKSNIVTADYIPDADIAYSLGRGICYDYSAVFAAMLRLRGIPCKVVFGWYKGAVYHAWNEYFLNGVWTHADLTVEDSGGATDLSNYVPDKYY